MNHFKEKVIIALDYNNIKSVKDLLKKLKGEAYFYKIGMELFVSCGLEAIKEVKESGCKIFLDLKFFDIPNTVYKSVRSAGLLGVDIVNVHASGGLEMMKAAKKGALEAENNTGKKIDVFAVTVLTSFSAAILFQTYYSDNSDKYNNKADGKTIVEKTVLRLANLAKISELDGVICSPMESMLIKQTYGSNFKTITPGIRLSEHASDYLTTRKKAKPDDDQKRVLSPSQAFAAKADYIVIGRPITIAPDPLASLKIVYDGIERSIKKL
jgi:orotidine-5'-phosphate decarboxylase